MSSVANGPLPLSTGAAQLLSFFKKIIPPLSPTAHKGQAGRIGIVGGSLEYTGAPYYAAMTSLKLGGDLAFVFCMRDAAIPLKSYSPELIVHPVLDADDPLSVIEERLPYLHALVLGPGLGRHPQIFATLGHILNAAKERQLLIVIDADALFFLNENYDIIQGYSNVILTPNRVEMARLYRAVLKKDLKADQVTSEHVVSVADVLKVTIACKGPIDIIATNGSFISCDIGGSPRRCGGQGDILSGAAALLFYWSFGTARSFPDRVPLPPAALAAWGACAVTRMTASLAFAENGRGTLTTDMIPLVSTAFSSLVDPK